MLDSTIDETGAEELKRIHNRFLDKRVEIMENTQFKAEDVLDDNLRKESMLPDYRADL